VDRLNNGDVTTYLDNHINQNFTANGSPLSSQTPQ
jgi:hypothetical protein